MIRVLSLNYEFPPIGGGGGNAHQQILCGFAEFSDLDVTLITTTPKPLAYEEHCADNVRIHYLPLKKESLHYWRRGEVLRYLTQHWRYLNRHLQTCQYDLCHVFFGFPSGFLAYHHRRRFPYLVSVRGSDVPGYNRRFGVDYWLLGPLLKRIYQKASAVAANSAALKALFDSHYPFLSAEVIPNGVDLQAFQPREKTNAIPQLITLARLIPRKGLDILIDACAELKREGFLFDLHIFGEGPERESLKQQAHKQGMGKAAHFHGRVEREQVRERLPQCDLFVLPSHAEGMPNAALEAMACGLPLVLTDTGGAKELITDNGVVVPKNNGQALTQTLKAMLSHPENLQRMGEASRRHAHQFSWETVCRRYYELYRQTVEGAAPHELV